MAPKAEFSEFNFGFSVTFERVLLEAGVLGGTWNLPLLPNQVIEAVLGFDAMFRRGGMGMPLCLQYKIPEELTKRHLTNHEKKHAGHGLQLPAYRFNIVQEQNETLSSLIGANVFYCISAFARQRDLEEHYRKQEIWKFVRLIRPPELTSG